LPALPRMSLPGVPLGRSLRRAGMALP
jgi:hypothetical protein